MKKTTIFIIGVMVGSMITITAWNFFLKDTFRKETIATYQCWHNAVFNEPCDTPTSDCKFTHDQVVKNGLIIKGAF